VGQTVAAFSPQAVYTPEQMAALVLYAQRRGVRVIAEYDIPAHSSFGKAFPNLVSENCPDQLDPFAPGR
jgi:N-acetyl-beta-hexosaminidase